MTQLKTGRLETTKLIRPMVTRHWNNIRQAHAEGRPIAWGAGLPNLITDAMDIPTHFMGGYASYCAGSGGADELLEAAEADGYLRETCSYHRMHLGNIALIEKGIPPKEQFFLPAPDLMVCFRACMEHAHYVEALYRHCKMPVIVVDVPTVYTSDEFEPAINFVVRQMKEEAIPALERFCGRKFNYDRLSELLATIKKAGMLRSECWELAAHKPAPCTIMDLVTSHGAILYGVGPHSIEYFQSMKEELELRVANNVAAVSGEKYRLMWDHIIPWHSMGLLPRKMIAYKANILMGRYTHEMFPHPEAIDPEDPLRTIADQYVRYWLQILTPTSISDMSGEKFFIDSIKKYSIDGIIMHNGVTCRIYSMGQHDILTAVREKLGTPGVIFEGDMADRQFFSESQFEIRLQALLETIDERRGRN